LFGNSLIKNILVIDFFYGCWTATFGCVSQRICVWRCVERISKNLIYYWLFWLGKSTFYGRCCNFLMGAISFKFTYVIFIKIVALLRVSV